MKLVAATLRAAAGVYDRVDRALPRQGTPLDLRPCGSFC